MSAEPRVLGRYALFGEIASGGMATVHLGRLLGPVGFSRTVAIKRLHEQFAKDPEFVSMFIDEARLAARIRHPNVVQTLDVVQEQGQLLLVMEYVHGQPLSTLIKLARKAGKRVPPAIAAAIVAGLLRGLHAAHEATDERGVPLGIVHRDVSPHNVLVGVDGIPRVLDFGVAKAAGRLHSTQQGQLKGKVPYMAPEQVRGLPLDRRSDVYSAAVVLWETLLGQRLFVADNEAAIITEILHREIEAPSKIDFDVPEAFDPVVLRGLARRGQARDPEARFETARDMAKAVESCFPNASPAEVGEWVERVASAQLGERSAQVTHVESTSSIKALPKDAASRLLGAASDDATTSPSSPAASAVATGSVSSVSVVTTAPQGRRVGIVAVLVAVMVAGAVGFVIAREAAHRGKPSPQPTIVAAPPPAPSASEPVAPPATSAPPSASASATASKPIKPAVVAPRPKPSAPAPAPPSANADCDPPYVIDAKGHKQYKMQCL